MLCLTHPSPVQAPTQSKPCPALVFELSQKNSGKACVTVTTKHDNIEIYTKNAENAEKYTTSALAHTASVSTTKLQNTAEHAILYGVRMLNFSRNQILIVYTMHTKTSHVLFSQPHGGLRLMRSNLSTPNHTDSSFDTPTLTKTQSVHSCFFFLGLFSAIMKMCNGAQNFTSLLPSQV